MTEDIETTGKKRKKLENISAKFFPFLLLLYMKPDTISM